MREVSGGAISVEASSGTISIEPLHIFHSIFIPNLDSVKITSGLISGVGPSNPKQDPEEHIELDVEEIESPLPLARRALRPAGHVSLTNSVWMREAVAELKFNYFFLDDVPGFAPTPEDQAITPPQSKFPVFED